MKLIRLKKPKISKTWLILGVAGIVGLLAALIASSYLSAKMSDIEAKNKVKTVSLVVAKVDILKGTKLGSNNLAVRQIPATYAQTGAVTPAQFNKLEGQVIAYDVPNGELIMWAMMESKKAPTFSTRVETGRRAITVPVDEINSISGLLEPGDLIDLVLTVDQKGQKFAAPMLQSIKVMATGQRSVDDPKSGERKTYSTVTLDTDFQQAQNLIMARETGKLTALLRNPGDKKPIIGVKADLSLFMGNARDNSINQQIMNKTGEVPVLYGGKSGKFDPASLRLGSDTKNNNNANTANEGTPLDNYINAVK